MPGAAFRVRLLRMSSQHHNGLSLLEMDVESENKARRANLPEHKQCPEQTRLELCLQLVGCT